MSQPIPEKPLRLPGESQREAYFTEIGVGAMPWLSAAVFAVLFAVLEWFRWLTNVPPFPVSLSLLAIIVCAFAAARIYASHRRARLHWRGAVGEVKASESLDWLRKDGYEVLHDVQCPGFNIDHVLIGPGGVVVETKSRQPRINGEQTIVQFDGESIRVNNLAPDRDPIEQVRKFTGYLARLIQQRTTLRPPMQAAVVVPDVYVKATGRADVWVLNRKQLPGAVRRLRPALSIEQIRMICSVLEPDCRSE
jgi:hypothetical protein